MTREKLIEGGREAEILPNEIREWYLQYARSTWDGIMAMDYPQTGLPADHLHYSSKDGKPIETPSRVDKTSPTNIGFSLACVGGASAMGFITPSEADRRIGLTLATLEKMMHDPNVFIPTEEGKGLLVNWIQPSTGDVLTQWPGSEDPVKQQISTVDNAWLMAFAKLTSAQFPQFEDRIQSLLDRFDLPFMFDSQTGFFRGCYVLNPPGFESWQYDVISEERIAYLVSPKEIAESMRKLFMNKSRRSVFVAPTGEPGRATWDGQWFQLGWPHLIVPEDQLNPQWKSTYVASVQAQRDFGTRHFGGHYGYSAGLGPDGKYYEFRVPETGESEEQYSPQPVVTVSALVNMGLTKPAQTCEALRELHWKYPDLTHQHGGDGDTVNTETGAVQRDQLLPNQAASLISCWNIVKDGEPQQLFMSSIPASATDIYRSCSLW